MKIIINNQTHVGDPAAAKDESIHTARLLRMIATVIEQCEEKAEDNWHYSMVQGEHICIVDSYEDHGRVGHLLLTMNTTGDSDIEITVDYCGLVKETNVFEESEGKS